MVLLAEIIYVQKENFWQQAGPVFLGAALAFLFSIAVFYITERIKHGRGESQLEQQVYREIQFNINFLNKMKIELDRLTQNVSANDTSILPVFKFNKLQRTFLLKAFNRGLLYKKLSDEEISTVDSMLGYFFETTNAYLRDRINAFISGDATPAETLGTLRYNADETAKYADFLQLIADRFKR